MHTPVMLKEVLRLINDYVSKQSENNISIVDLTLGYGGHSGAIFNLLKEALLDSCLISLDWDNEAINSVLKENKENLAGVAVFNKATGVLEVEYKGVDNLITKWWLIKSNFAYISDVIKQIKNQGLCDLSNKSDVMLADLGVSSPQLDNPQRGFSFKANNGVLDMRMDPDTYTVNASDLLNVLSIKELERLFINTVGMSKSVAKNLALEIVRAREDKPFGDNDDIKRIKNIAKRLNTIRYGARKRLNPATLVFLALRIATNMEYQNIISLMETMPKLLKDKGLGLVIGFHSGEWSLLKQDWRGLELIDVIEPLSKEIESNPRSRSAKLFVYRNHA